MDNETFKFLEQLAAKMDAGFNKVNEKIDSLETKVQKVQLEIENKINPKLDTLFEEVIGIKEKLVKHDSRFDAIESKIESQDFEIKVLKKAK
jgi:predicted  nucleic acid-binding Zn-ribbon protein